MKNWKKYMSLLLALLSFSLLAGCGSSVRKWRDTDVIDDYGTITRDGEQIDVCITHDRNAIYLYYNDETHELFDTALLPTDEIYDTDWELSVVSLYSNGDLQVYLSHSDMSESNIVWEWEEGTGYVYQPDYSRFYYPIVIYDPLEDTVNDFSTDEDIGQSEEENHYDWNRELFQRNVSAFQGTWYYEEDLSAETFIIIDGNGNWSFFRRNPGDAEGTEIDHGTFSYSTDESSTYYADSAIDDNVRYRVFEFDENALIWDEGIYYRME